MVSLFGNDPRRIGGTEEYARELSLQLGERGWRSVLCFPGPAAAAVEGHLALPNVVLEVIPRPWVNSLEVVRQAGRLLRRHRPRILHYMYTGFIGPYPWLGRLCGVERIFFTDHGSHPESYTPRRAPAWKRIAARWINRPLTGVISVSEFNRRLLGILDTYPPERVHRIFNGVRLPSQPLPDSAGFCRKYGIPEGRAVVTQVGSMTPEKGVGDVLEAARRVLDRTAAVQFVFVGDGPWLERYRQEARPLGDHATFTGLVTDPGAEGVYAASDVVCQASRWQEAFGLVIAEAMAFGKPVIATAVGGIPELVEEGRTGFLVPRGDSAALADRILRLLNAPELRRELGGNARRAAEAHFDIRRIVARHLALYGIVPGES